MAPTHGCMTSPRRRQNLRLRCARRSSASRRADRHRAGISGARGVHGSIGEMKLDADDFSCTFNRRSTASREWGLPGPSMPACLIGAPALSEGGLHRHCEPRRRHPGPVDAVHHKQNPLFTRFDDIPSRSSSATTGSFSAGLIRLRPELARHDCFLMPAQFC